MGMIRAYDKVTGDPHMIPEHWFDSPRLGGNFSRIRPSEAVKKAAAKNAEAEAKAEKEN